MKHTPTPWVWINANHSKSRLGHLFGDGEMILDTPDFIYGESVNAVFIVKACNNHEILLQALKDIEGESDNHGCGSDSMGDTIDEMARVARAAIKQAKES